MDQFYSDLSVRDLEGRELVRKTIYVNEPLRFGGITAYQTDWSMAALVVRARGTPVAPEDGSPITVPLASLEGTPGFSGRVWGTFLPAELPKDASQKAGPLAAAAGPSLPGRWAMCVHACTHVTSPLLLAAAAPRHLVCGP